jgi:asparagine synthase (glutamine-hydrolysing)
MATERTARVKTFSVGFPDERDSELRWARLVANRYQTDHQEAILEPNIEELVLAVVRRFGEPFGDSSAVATYCLSKMTREHVSVALSGDAADETFGGYTRYRTARLAHVYDALPRQLRGAYRATSLAIARAFVPHMTGYVQRYADGEAVRYPYIMCQFTPEEKEDLYLPAMRDARTDSTTERFDALLTQSGSRSPLRRVLELDWQTYLIDDINVKVDRASMAHALEVRCPFLDTSVVEFAARLPARLLMRLRGKYLLRRALANLVPPEVLSRKKRGFALPLRRWMRFDLAELTRDTLLDKTARERGLFDPGEVSRLFRSLSHDYRAPDRLWTLLLLELWFREFVDRPAAPSA